MNDLFFYPKLLSTNLKLKEMIDCDKLDEFSIVLTDFQEAGRGQKGNTWESEDGKNLLFSILLKPTSLPIDEQFKLSQIVSLAIKETLEHYIGRGVMIKWPNDIYYRDKKICGILIENILDEQSISHSIVGIGLNINQKHFVSDIPNPISMTQITGDEYDLLEILDQFVAQLYQLYEYLVQGEDQSYPYLDYVRSLYRKDGIHTYQDESGIFQASIEGIDKLGCLILKKEGSGLIKKYAFKEVSYI